jgi:hypothetical protein
MRKFFLFLSLVSLCTLGQAQQTGDVDFGVKAGVDVSTFKGEGTNGSDVSSRTSINIGFLMQYFMASAIALRPELFYAGHGAKEGDFTYRFSSVFVPLLLTYYISAFYLMAGPQISFLMAAQSKSPSGTSDIKDYYRAVNFALVGGLGYMLGKNFGIDARYNWGVGHIHKTSTAAVQNSIFMISLFWLFNRK